MATEEPPKDSMQIENHATDPRAFQNKFPEYTSAVSNETWLIKTTHELVINQAFVAKIRTFIDEQLELIGGKYLYKYDRFEDRTIYTGGCGIAFLFIQLCKSVYKDDENVRNKFLEKAGEILEKARKKVYKAYPAFLMGDGGPWALSILYAKECGDKEGIAKYTEQLINLKQLVLSETGQTEDEVLYGNAGYLYCLLLVRKLVPEADIQDSIIKQVSDVIIARGRKQALFSGPIPPLMYSFAETQYLGAAHGLTGIIYMLLSGAEVTNCTDNIDTFRSCIDYIQGTKLPSGNFPTKIGEANDLLVHWCHGAPGTALLFCKAYSLTQNTKYLKTAVSSARAVWERGLLRKGVGLCHGVAGNAYTFLQLYKVTQDGEYLYYALKFAEWCMEARGAWGQPDRPYTLFEGMAGTLYFLSDLLDLKNAAFPGYEI